MGTVNQSLGFDLTSMANLRLLCVLIVLAAVCWEANCWTKEKCGHFNTKISCWFGRVIHVKDAAQGHRIKHRIFWGSPKYYNDLTARVRDKCDGHHKCYLNSNQGNHYCTKVHYSCRRKSVLSRIFG